MKTKTWILLLALVAVACGLLSFVFLNPSKAETAQIFSDGKLVRTVMLNVDQEFTVELDGGFNIVTVKDGKIAVTEASCPDSYCMKRGYCDGGAQIVCLPNRLVIKFVGKQDVDGVVG